MKQPVIRSINSTLRAVTVALLALVPGLLSGTAIAQNLVQNGTFAITGGTGTSFQFGLTGGSYAPTESLADWTSTGYNFVFLSGATTAAGSSGSLSLGTNPTTTPGPGGNYVAADPIYEAAPVDQTINGLVAGQTYAVSFAWAEAQQTTFTGTVYDYWTVNLGTNSATVQTTQASARTIPTQSFSGWMYQTFDFVATTTGSEVLSFLATAPSGNPPFALLANVSLTQVPEPTSVALLLTGVAGLVGIARRRRSVAERVTAAG